MTNSYTPGPWTWRMEKVDRGVLSKGKIVHMGLTAPRPNCPPPYSTGVLTPNWCTDRDGEVWQAWISVKEEDASLIAAAPDLLDELRNMCKAYVRLLENGRDRIIMLGGDCDPVDRMEANSVELIRARAAIAKATGENND